MLAKKSNARALLAQTASLFEASRIMILLFFLIGIVCSQCPPGLTPLYSNNNFNTPMTCTPQDSCSCYSGSSRSGALCQYASQYSNYICCYSTNTQCGSNSSPQISASGQVVSCSTSTQCASGYSCNYGVCCPSTTSCSSSGNNGQCLTGQVLVNGQCYNSVPIGSACQSSQQCTGGSTCLSSMCQCQSGYVNVNNQCVISNGLNCQLGTVSFNSQCISLASPGQSCQTSSQCIDNSVCSNAVCTCNSNYQMVYGYCVPYTSGNCKNTQTLVNGQCVLFSIVGESCIASQQCVGGASCNSGTCQCLSGATAMYGYCISSSTGSSCSSNQVSINGICYNTVQIGGSCSFSQQCLNQAVCTNSVCVSSFCSIQCSSNQVCISNQCYNYVSVGSQCVGSQQCLSSSQCIGSICQCPQGYQLSNGVCTATNNNGNCNSNQVYYNGQCWNTVSIGSQCSITQQCLGNSQCLNSFCQCPSGSSNVNGYCQGGTNGNCNSNQVYYNGQCWNTFSIGSQCSITQQCLGNSQCLNSFCQCSSGSSNVNGYCQGGTNGNCNSNQIYYNGQCYNTVSIGSQCSITQQCLGNSQCLNSFCQCPSGSSNVNGYCQGGSSGSCNSNQVLYNNQCYNTVSIGSQCSITQQCIGNSQCLNSFCQCPSGSSNVNGYCQGGSNGNCNSNQVLYNGQCWNTVSIGSQCSITQQCLGNSQCLNSFCQCPTGSSNVNGVCSTSSSTSNLCSSGQTVQLDSSNNPINCLVSACPTNSFCQYSQSGQRYVCCRSSTSGKKK